MKNPYPLMDKMDLFVCSSRAEGYSLVIAEAMILGLPVISTNCAGPKELLDNGNYGMIVENHDEALYEGINNIILAYRESLSKVELASPTFFSYVIDKVIKEVKAIL